MIDLRKEELDVIKIDTHFYVKDLSKILIRGYDYSYFGLSKIDFSNMFKSIKTPNSLISYIKFKNGTNFEYNHQIKKLFYKSELLNLEWDQNSYIDFNNIRCQFELNNDSTFITIKNNIIKQNFELVDHYHDWITNTQKLFFKIKTD